MGHSFFFRLDEKKSKPSTPVTKIFTSRWQSIHVATLLICISLSGYGQENTSWHVTPQIGLTSPILDNGYGFFVAAQVEKPLNKWVSGEMQLSFSYNRITAAFLNGEQGHQRAINWVLGPRIYFNSKDRLNTFFGNALFGAVRVTEIYDPPFKSQLLSLGHSIGLFWSRKRHLLGVSFDSYGLMSIRYGFSL